MATVKYTTLNNEWMPFKILEKNCEGKYTPAGYTLGLLWNIGTIRHEKLEIRSSNKEKLDNILAVLDHKDIPIKKTEKHTYGMMLDFIDLDYLKFMGWSSKYSRQSELPKFLRHKDFIRGYFENYGTIKFHRYNAK